MEKTSVTIIGAGVVGLSIAAEISDIVKDMVVIEKHPCFGQETSSRNSEVIHAGIYYEKDSLKAQLCVRGNHLLYQICHRQQIPHQKIGKLIVAANDGEIKELEKLLARGRKNGVEELEMVSSDKIRQMEPNIKARAGLWSPFTGIIDTHSLMKYLEFSAREKGVTMVYGCEVTSIARNDQGYMIGVQDSDGESFSFSSQIVINSAGLEADKVAALAGIDIDVEGYRLHYCKGEYFRLVGGKHKLIQHLIYPLPTPGGLGIHTVADLQGRVRLGPNAFYVPKIDYQVDESHRKEFYDGIKPILPFVEERDIMPDMAGIRPKLQSPGCQQVRDFVIRHEEERGLPGLINLIGIESPGLTASPAIAQYVKEMVREII